MQLHALRAHERGLMKTKEFMGYSLFSNGQRGVLRRDNFGAVYVFNDDYLDPDSYLGMHPHAGVEIVTIMIEGEESHQDSLGYYQEMDKGDVQLISSGTGIEHAGGNRSSGKVARHFQIWIAPSMSDTIPSTKIKKASGKEPENEWVLLLSPDGKHETLSIKQIIWIIRGEFNKGLTVSYPLEHEGNGVMIYITKGKIKVGNLEASKEDTLFITHTNHFEIQIDEEASLLLIETGMYETD
jgi:redox-sensitive bicupin YhaK (pirin superfamily)